MKKLSLLLITMTTLIMVAACGGNETQPDDPLQNEESAGGDLTSVRVMLDWYPNAVHTYLYTAIEEGYFEQEGLDVELIFPTNPTDPINLAASGGVELGITYQPDVIMARANDIPVVSIAAVVKEPLNYMMILEDSDIQSPKDLEGKDVGYPGIPLNEPLLKTMVENDGGNIDQVNLIDVGFELGSSIVSERVDAVIGTFINHEFPVLQNKGYDVRYFNPADYGVPNYYELVIVTNDDYLLQNREVIEAFWRAASKGFEDVKNNSEAALDILFENQDQANFPLIREVEEQSLGILLPKMATENESFGSQTEDAWQQTIDWLLEVGLINEAPEVEDIFVNMTN
ncbi:ABC transporter substrate-binding protein [Anaerobacillus sp. MEB173]|uniref:ABC transporter substrate-binding protein n=1 Tax=Anaerobacillus sp. MEB173 TaxID=3383345 RepID=UPI003F8E0397